MPGDAERLDSAESAKWWEETGAYELRQILLWRWDPIGIAGEFPYAADEYDSYAPQLVIALSNGASANEIAALLGSIESERMGLGEGSLHEVHVDRLQTLGESILAWFESSRLRWLECGRLSR
ncbi:hypothetical protein QN239_02820 [Mycolicibacterium sp. Y3]